jgi:hypothetical protein
MAVGAAHLALVDLGFDSRPCPPASCVGRDVGYLVADVIELENDDVTLAAIHARMLSQVVDDLLTDLGAPIRDVFVDSSPLTFVVLPIVPRVRFGEAIATPRLEFRLAAPDRWKRVERLHFAAFRARSHERRACRSVSVGRIGRPVSTAVLSCDPGATRTRDQQLRRLLLYPLSYGVNHLKASA